MRQFPRLAMHCTLIGVAVLLCAGLLVLASAPAGPSAAERPRFAPDSYMVKIQKRGKLIAAVKSELPGVGYLNPLTRKYEGFAIGLAEDLAQKLFREPGRIEFKPSLPKTRITMLTEGVADVAIETMFITPERKAQIDFAEPYWGSPTLIFVRKENNTIKGVADLEGKRVASAKGSATERDFRERKYGYPKVELLLFDSPADGAEAVRAGRADATVFDEAIGLSIMKIAPYYKFVGQPIKYSYYGIGIAKGRPEFVEFINQWLREIKASGRWKEIYRKNLPGEPPDPPMPPFDKAFH